MVAPFVRRSHQPSRRLRASPIARGESSGYGRRAVVRDERGVRDRHVLLQEQLARLGVAADLALRRLRVAQRDEVHQGARVDRPVELGVGPDRQHGPRQLARDALLDQLLVGAVGGLVDLLEPLARGLRELGLDRLERVRPGLADLRAHVLGRRHVELVGRPRVAHRELVERPDAVPEPLARDEDRRAHVEAKRVVLERRPVPLAHQEADQALVRLVHLVDAPREADPSAVHDREVVRHRVVEPHEAVIEDADGVVGYHFGGGDCHAGECTGGICRHFRLVLPHLAGRVLPREGTACGLPDPLLGAPAVGRAEHERVPAAVRGALQLVGGAGGA